MKKNILIVGAGGIGTRHIRCFLKTKRCQIYVCEPRSERVKEIKQKYPIKKLNNFIYSEKEDKLICQKGFSSIGKSKYSDGYLYYFSSEVCKSCNRKKEYSLNKDRARVYISDSHILYIKSNPEQKKKALEKRKRIEAKFGEAKKHHRMTRAKYRGK